MTAITRTIRAAMNLSRKIILLVISTFIALIFIVAAASDVILLKSYSKLEKDVLQNNFQKVHNEIEETFPELDAVARSFQEQLLRQQRSILEKPGLETFRNHRIDFLMCFDAAAEPVSAYSADFHNGRLIELNDELLKKTRLVALLALKKDNRSVHGYLAVGPVVSQVAVRPLDNGGIVLVGRYFDSDELERIVELTDFSLMARPVAGNVPADDFAQAIKALVEGAGFYTRIQEDSRISGYSLFTDVFGKPALVLKITEKRILFEKGKVAIYYILVVIFLCGAVFCAVTLVFLRGTVLKRMSDLSAKVVDISRNGDVSTRLDVHGEDELDALAGSINSMLESLHSAETKIRESEERYRMLFERAPDAIIVLGMEGEDRGRVIAANQAAAQLHGYTLEEFRAKTVFDLNTPEANQAADRIFESIANGEWIATELWHLKKDGTRFPIEVHAGPIKINGRNYILGFDRDITARKLAEEADHIYMAHIDLLNAELTGKAQELAAANAELEAFNYSVSHDMRGPLTRISGYCQLMQDDGVEVTPQHRTYVSRIYESSQWLNEMIEAMLMLSRLNRAEFNSEEVNLSALAGDVLREHILTDPERSVETVVAAGVTATGDANLLKILMSNLIGNAWKYTALTVQARIEFGVDTGGRVPVYFVRDNGAGFDMKDADRLFRVFTRLHDQSRFSGNGIGLATVRRVITRHGGRIWAEGEVGKGATFFFTLSPDTGQALNT